MTLEAMVKAVNEGKTVVDEDGNKVFMDLKHAHRPYIYQHKDGTLSKVKYSWENYDDFEILEEPKQEQITDRFELMELCRKWDKEGKRFLVSNNNRTWIQWEYFAYTSPLKDYQWTALDETGHPTGEPQKFMREVEV